MASEHVYLITCASCQLTFQVCANCYNRHRYCSIVCRRVGYAICHRKHNKTYMASLEAKLDHRDRNRLYRARKRSNDLVSIFVTDETSDLRLVPVKASTELQQSRLTCRFCGGHLAMVGGYLGEDLDSLIFYSD
jgi:hypothetical protein